MRRDRPEKERGRRPLGRVLACLGVLGSLVWSGGLAQAHGPPRRPAPVAAEARLRASERLALGSAHAAEHARERAIKRLARRRWKQLTRAQRQQVRNRERAQQHALERAAGPPSQVGAWSRAPFGIPNFAIHAAVLPSGKVLLIGFAPVSQDPRPIDGYASLWDPALGIGPEAFRSVPPPLADVDGDGVATPAPIHCAGHAFLPNGALLFAGGTLVWPSTPGDAYTIFAGHDRVFTFDPWRESWQEQPRMGQGRWYPTVVETADGRSMILGGFNEQAPGGVANRELEVFRGARGASGIGRLGRRPSGDRAVSLYPHLFTVPGGNILLAGPGDEDSGLLDPSTFTWRELPDGLRTRVAGNAVILPGGPAAPPRIEQIGGYDPGVFDASGNRPATATTEVLDSAQPEAGSSAGPSLNYARSNANTVLLPDGSMVVVGGGSGKGQELGQNMTAQDGRLRQVELYDPETKSWRLGPPQREDRTYHSTAVLLPDGRVLSAGDNYYPVENGVPQASDTAEIYSPPYLFNGRRPEIASAPGSVRAGDPFTVGTRGSVAQAVLMAPGATTHAADMTQRYVRLEVLQRFGQSGAKLLAPPDGGRAPPGYYMLFVLNAEGVPSRARWVRIHARGTGPPLLDAGERP